ncbi:MAG: DUF4252 domain-containing protein [Flavobacteriaceae bacterium]|nr:DUF4252 domain-containing protein [Bacteroidia bacterium]NNF75937.1 DUF4252 domain-containing protein [Flavobacteriaceae bacterium]NNK72089.1 DUF4252 domain-containing protein [Flavobacteriaceae bacterium]
MLKSIKNGVMALLLVTTLVGCDQKESLQAYYVNNQEAPNFMSVDIPVSFVNLENVELTADQKEAYESIDKLNMLGYQKKENNEEEYRAELEKVRVLLKDEKYEELFRGGNNKDGRVIIKYIGTDTTIDELIVFGNANATGFAIIRVLGDKMDPAKIMKLGDVINKIESEENAVQDFMEFFSPLTGKEIAIDSLSIE